VRCPRCGSPDKPSLQSIIRDIPSTAETGDVGTPIADEYDLFILACHRGQGRHRPWLGHGPAGPRRWRLVRRVRAFESEIACGGRSIKGLARSRFGLVILSHPVPSRRTGLNTSSNGLVALEMAGRQRIPPPSGTKSRRTRFLGYSALARRQGRLEHRDVYGPRDRRGDRRRRRRPHKFGELASQPQP